jgi:hypothetical protein
MHVCAQLPGGGDVSHVNAPSLLPQTSVEQIEQL